MLGIASLIPLVTLAANPDLVLHNPWGAWVYHGLGFENFRSFLIFVGVITLVTLVSGNALSFVTTWSLNRYVSEQQHQVGHRLLLSYLRRPYGYFITRNCTGLARNVLSEVSNGIGSMLTPALELWVRLLQATAIAGLLLIWTGGRAILPIIVLVSLAGLIYLLIRRVLLQLGNLRLDAQKQQFKIAIEALESIKDTKVLGREESLAVRYVVPSLQANRCAADAQSAGLVPRFLMDTVALGGMVLLLVGELLAGYQIADILPALSVYAFAAYRLVPALKEMSNSVAQMRYLKSALDLLYNDLIEESLLEERLQRPPESLPFEREVELANITFTYPNAAEPTLLGLTLAFPKNSTIGFVGMTGAGKTTLVDLLLGLLRPDSGELRVDGLTVREKNLAAWRAQLGYVTQSIFLVDDTLARNIALGLADEEVDLAAVERAARIANLHDFVMRELPEGYQTVVGDRGIRLSGGQKQRVGIARALYHDPSVIVFDEATSALDNVTEEAVMEAIHQLQHKKTVLIIAHRLSTVLGCDQINVMSRGSIVARGTYRELLERCPEFQALARVGPCSDEEHRR